MRSQGRVCGPAACALGILVLVMFHGAHASYLIGIGKADMTGPPADVNMLGYAEFNQTARGLHIRQYARAFIVADPNKTESRVLYVSIDAGMPSQLVTIEVTGYLQEQYKGLYSINNTIITATHSHSGAGGFQQYLLYSLTSLGFVPQMYNIVVEAIKQAVAQAHASLAPGQVTISSTQLVGVSINRSPSAYVSNPAEERARYKSDTDRTLTLVKFKDLKGNGRGLMAFYGVHPVSMSNKNQLLSGDTYGAAEQLMEKGWGKAAAAADSSFVAAMIITNHADTSPNTQGAFCGKTDQRCDQLSSTCDGDNQSCLGRGPGWPDDFKSTRIHATKMAAAAEAAWDSKQEVVVNGPIDSRHLYFDITDMEVKASNFTRAGRTCVGAMGWSFAAGTTDGPGSPGFYQGDTNGHSIVYTPLSGVLNGLFKAKPTKEEEECQHPKPILLNVGAAQKPYPMVPAVVEVSVFRIGSLVTVHMPSEFTTMAGRRLMDAVYQTVRKAWGADVKVLMSSVTNTYSSYTTTYEEYQVQRYEGASTLYGPHTLGAYIQTAVDLATAMVKGQPVVSKVQPPNLRDQQISLLPPVLMDTVPLGTEFGDVVQDVNSSYSPGDTVEVVFRTGNPRSNPRTNSTFLTVEYSEDGKQWQVVYTDDDWCTRFAWTQPKKALMSESLATITWEIPADAPAGLYRIQHYGSYKLKLLGDVVDFGATSGVFKVVTLQRQG